MAQRFASYAARSSLATFCVAAVLSLFMRQSRQLAALQWVGGRRVLGQPDTLVVRNREQRSER